MPLEILNYSTILIELNKAVKMHNFYPEGHPNLDSALEKCYLSLKKALDEHGEIKWRVDQKGFYDGKNIISPGNQDVASLAKKVFFRRIKEMTFTPRLTLRDMKIFLSVLKLEPEEIQARGGVETVFAEKDIAGLLVNELRYEDLRKLKKELEEKQEEEKNEQTRESAQAETEKGESAEEEKDEAEPPQKEEAAEEDPLPALLERIRNETDFLRYNDLSVRIREKADILVAEQKFEEAFQALLIFLEHSSPDAVLADDIKAAASDSLGSLLDGAVIKYLVERLGKKEEPFRTAIQKMLLSAGIDAVEPLLNAILGAPEAVSRRHYFNAIVLFGPSIRPQVESRLAAGGEWFEARQMISILGELGDPRAIEALAAAYRHPDLRVKKEVLKSLVKIRSPRSADLLMKALEENDLSLVNQAIISLGMLKDGSAVDVLGRIALESQESRKEAIKALGIIGDRKAVPYLTRILFRRVWFGKKAHEELRSLAANSLGMIGGPEAYSAIEQACEQSAGELYSACKRILEGREKNT